MPIVGGGSAEKQAFFDQIFEVEITGSKENTLIFALIKVNNAKLKP